MPPIPWAFSSAAASSASSSRSPATKRCTALLKIGFWVTVRSRRGLPAAHSSSRLTMTSPRSFAPRPTRSWTRIGRVTRPRWRSPPRGPGG